MSLLLLLRRVRALLPYFPEPRRTLYVTAESRMAGIGADARRTAIGLEDRATEIAAELRVLIIPAAPTTLYIQEG